MNSKQLEAKATAILNEGGSDENGRPIGSVDPKQIDFEQLLEIIRQRGLSMYEQTLLREHLDSL